MGWEGDQLQVLYPMKSVEIGMLTSCFGQADFIGFMSLSDSLLAPEFGQVDGQKTSLSSSRG